MYDYTKMRTLREIRALTHTDLTFELDKLGLRISRQTLISWESGATAPNANDVAIIARFFDKPVQYFFDPKAK